MKAMKLVQIMGIICLLAVGAALVGVNVTSMSKRDELRRSIAEQDTEKEEIKLERARLDSTIQSVGKEMSALPDTLRTARMGYAARRSQGIGKSQVILDGRETRANARLRTLNRDDEALGRWLRRANGVLGGLGVLLVGILFVLKKVGS
jgi:septal ring factor EnvC (AmiA/AmiB activator)